MALVAPAAAWAAPAKNAPTVPGPPTGSKVLERRQEGALASVLYETRGAASEVVAHYQRVLARRGMTVQVSQPEPADALKDGELVKVQGQALFGRSRTEVATISLSTQPDGKVRIRAEWCGRSKPIDAAALAEESKLPFPGQTTGGFPDLITLNMICQGRLAAFVKQWQSYRPATGAAPRPRADFSSGFDEPAGPPSLHGTMQAPPPPPRPVLREQSLQTSGPLARNRVSVNVGIAKARCDPPAALIGATIKVLIVIGPAGSVLGAEITGSTDKDLAACLRKALLASAYPRASDGQPTRVTAEWKVVDLVRRR